MSGNAALPWNGLDGLINSKPFMPQANPSQQAVALMELAEQDGERLGRGERRLVLRFAEAVRDYRQMEDFINELCEEGHELRTGYVDAAMEGFVRREIARASKPAGPLTA